MAQPSVAQFFNTRKRSAISDNKVERARKVLILSQDETEQTSEDSIPLRNNRIVTTKQDDLKEVRMITPKLVAKKSARVSKLKKNEGSNQNIQNMLENMKNVERCVTPPNQSIKEVKNDELVNIKKKISQSTKLEELKASINRFKASADQLKSIEKKTSAISQSPKLKTFKSIEFEIPVSPQKIQSPEKPYLSPKKESSVRRNLLNVLSPTKSSTSTKYDHQINDSADAFKTSLQLPFKYRTLSEIFRATDTVAQILYNRKELITFKKLKPAVEEMLKRNFWQRHLAQLKSVYPNAYEYTVEKIKMFGMRVGQEQWELIVNPIVNRTEGMTSQILLDRRRKLNELLIDKVKHYHNEFLLSLDPPMNISKEDITRWHPEFDIEKVPDIELGDLPQVPVEEKYSSGKVVLEKARQMFNCNTRMEQALLKLQEARDRIPVREEEPSTEVVSVLKGIPKALLEKVRQKQAAKALMSMTRTVEKEKELQMYSRLPELARVTRSIFVTEKKSVLELDVIIDKLGNSYRCFLTKKELEDHLKAITKEVPDWLVFHKLRNSVFLKLSKNADLSVIVSKLEKLAKEKSEL